MDPPSTLSYGHLALLRPTNNSIRKRWPIEKSKITFGRLATCDCRILVETCSKLHAAIVIQEEAPHQATLEVYSVNGLKHQGKDFPKDSIIPLANFDIITICDRIFRWESASSTPVHIQSPGPSSRRPLRYSLISSAKINTPSRPSNAVLAPVTPALINLEVSPSKPAPPPAPVEAVEAPEADEPEPESEVIPEVELPRGERVIPVETEGAVITFDQGNEEELDDALVEEEFDEHVEEVMEIAEMEDVSTTPTKAEPSPLSGTTFLHSTPDLSQRARSLRAPTSVGKSSKSPTTSPTTRRRSLRMTIVPSNVASEWIRERDEKRRVIEEALLAAEAAAVEIVERIVSHKSNVELTYSPPFQPSSPSPFHQLPSPSTPAPSTPIASNNSSPRAQIASPSSSTSRRISMLLMSPARGASPVFAYASPMADGEADDDSSSSEEEEDVEAAHVETAEIRSRSSGAIVEPAEVDAEVVQSEEVEAQFEDVEQDSIAPVASQSDAFPGTPIGSSPSTPAPSPQHLIPRHSLSRRLSLREKVLIRSAIKKAVTPPAQSPDVAQEFAPISSSAESVVSTPSKEPVVLAPKVVEQVIRPQDVPLPETPAPVTFSIPTEIFPIMSPRTPRDSLDLAHSRAAAATPSRAAPFTPTRSVIHGVVRATKDSAIRARGELVASPAVQPVSGASSTSEDGSSKVITQGTPVTKSNTFKSLSTRKATPRAQQQAAASNVALPQTPAGEEHYTDAEAEIESTPIRTPFRESLRDAFQSEMTSPVNQHRVLPTPRSALRAPMTNTLKRKKSLRGFLAPFGGDPSASAVKRRVVFNEEVYIQEIMDIRDKSLHWDAKVDEPCRVESPVTRTQTTPRRLNSTPATSTAAPSPSPRKAQRVPTDTPSSIVQKAIEKAKNEPIASPRRVPISQAHGTPSKSPSKAVSSAGVPARSGPPAVATPSKARRVVVPAYASTQGAPSTAARAARQSEIQSLLATPSQRPPSTFGALPKTAPRNKPSATLATSEMSSHRRSSMLSQKIFPPTVPASVVVPSTPQPAASTEPTLPPVTAPSTNATSSTPIRARSMTHTVPRPLPTPSLSSTFRNMFSSSSNVLPPATPNFSGFRNLFATERERTIPDTPGMGVEGMARMMEQAEEEQVVEVVEEVVAEVVTEPILEDEVAQEVVEEVIEEVVQAEIVLEDPSQEIVEDSHLEDVLPSVEEQVIEEQSVEEMAPILEVPQPVVEEAPILEPALDEQRILIEPVQFVEPVVESVVEPVVDLVVEPVVELAEEPVVGTVVDSAPSAAITEVEAEGLEVAPTPTPAPVRRGRAAKGSSKKADNKVEPLPVEAVAPVRKATRGAKKAVEAPVLETPLAEEPIVEAPVVRAPVVKRGRAAKAPVTEVPPAVEESMAPVAKSGRGKKAKVEAVVETTEVVQAQDELEEEAVAPVHAKGRKAAPKKAATAVSVGEPEVVKKVPAPRKRGKAVEILEDAAEVDDKTEVEPILPARKATRGKKTLQSSSGAVEAVTEVVAKPARGRAKAAPAQISKENVDVEQPVAPVRALRARR